jgi:RHS repeat-associated protein
VQSTCATDFSCLLAHRLGHHPEVLEEGEGSTLGEVLVYDHFGSLTTETDLLPRFAFHFLELDDSVPLFAAQARCYDPRPGRGMELDPIGFAAGDANLSRYVSTEPTGILLNEDGMIRDA